MRVWVLTNEYRPVIIGGLGIVATELSKALAKDTALELTILTKGMNRQVLVSSEEDLTLVRFPKDGHFTSPADFYPEPISRFLDENLTAPPDLVHVHSVQCTELALFCQRRWEVPLVYTCHSLVNQERPSQKREKHADRQEQLLRAADRITVPSDWLKGEIERQYPFCQGKITVLENGVRVRPAARLAPRHRLLFVGRLVCAKGIEELLEAVALLRKEEPRVQLDVIGTGSEQYTAHLHALCERLCLGRTVRWLGYQNFDRVRRAYARAGAVIMPSRTESFGLVALEALAAGVPLVSTRAGGLAHHVDDTVAAIIPDVTAESIARAVREMWNDPRRSQLRRKTGLVRAARFCWPEIASRYGALFRALISERGK
jgi:glycogen(starch) synthase